MIKILRILAQTLSSFPIASKAKLLKEQAIISCHNRHVCLSPSSPKQHTCQKHTWVYSILGLVAFICARLIASTARVLVLVLVCRDGGALEFPGRFTLPPIIGVVVSQITEHGECQKLVVHLIKTEREPDEECKGGIRMTYARVCREMAYCQVQEGMVIHLLPCRVSDAH